MLNNFVENVKYKIISAKDSKYINRQFEIFIESDKFSSKHFLGIVFYLKDTPEYPDEKLCFKDEDVMMKYLKDNGIDYVVDKDYAQESIKYFENKIEQLKKLYNL